MMAGSVFVLVEPTGFWLGFVISEVIVHLTSLNWEDLLMTKKALCEITAYAMCSVTRAIASPEAHLPSRRSLLMSSLNPSEKGEHYFALGRVAAYSA
jgi:hypothetical protein